MKRYWRTIRGFRMGAVLLLCGVGAAAQTGLQLGASYDQLAFRGLGGLQVAASLGDCQGSLCWVEGSAYGTGALQASGHYTLATGTGIGMTLISQGNGAFTASEPTAWWLLFQSSSGSLAGELQLQQAQDSPASGQLTVTGQLSNVSGSLASSLGAGASLTLLLYDGGGLQNLLGNTTTATGSIAPGSNIGPASTSPTTPATTATTPTATASAALDAYGGLSDVTVAAGTGYFRVQKVGQRWVFVDPDGHPFWMLGVFAVDVNTDTPAGATYTLGKYGGSATWGLQAVKRLRGWGFNSTAEYSSAYVVPVNEDGSYETGDPMPWVAIMRPSYYSLRNTYGYAPAPVKDLVHGLDAVYSNYRGDTLPDVFDPNFATYTNAFLAAHTSAAEAASGWLIGTAVDDLDDLWGFGPGPDLPAARSSSNLGWIALCTDFAQAGNSRLGLSYSDPKTYTKYALANWLQNKYGTIAALDQAWGAQYTSFGDGGGYGTGTGLLDEDGRNPWVGADDAALSTANPQVRADLNGFLAVYAQKYFSIVSAALRQYRPHQLIFGPCTLNGWNGISRGGILAAAGRYTDVIQASMATQQVYDLSLQEAGDRPFVTWTGMPANPDSDLAAYPNPNAPGVYASQGARGAGYAAQVEADFAWTGSSAAGAGAGSQNVVGSKFWAWTDSWGEATNWGLVSFLDNAYDGAADAVALGVDAWGYPTGGEAANYGNFIGPATQANLTVVRSLKSTLVP